MPPPGSLGSGVRPDPDDNASPPIIQQEPRPQQAIAQGRVDAGIQDPALLIPPAQLLHQRLDDGQIDALPMDRRQEQEAPQSGGGVPDRSQGAGS